MKGSEYVVSVQAKFRIGADSLETATKLASIASSRLEGEHILMGVVMKDVSFSEPKKTEDAR